MNVRRNVLINLSGAVAPLLVSLATVPFYLHKIGDARYGVLAIVWLLVGYFGLFDLGLSRATANQIAKLRDSPPAEREKVFWSALVMNAAFGLVGGIVLYAAANLAFHGLFKVPQSIEPELVPTLPWIALSIPVATVSGVLTGTLEGRNRFGLVNAIQVAGTIVSQIVPLLIALLVGPSLTLLIPATILCRMLSSGVMGVAAARVLELTHPQWPTREIARSLLGYGAWITVTNIVSPLLDAADRLIIGAILGVRSVTYYAIPYNLAGRMTILPGALSRTLFPLLSYESQSGSQRIASQGTRVLATILTPIVVVGIVLMRPFLTVWVGAEVADRSFVVGEIVLFGVWMNSMAYMPYTQLQGQARPEIVAKFHLFEFVPFLGVLWAGLHLYGLAGAAAAWSLRVTADAILLYWAAGITKDTIVSLLPLVAVIGGTCVMSLATPLPSALGWVLGSVALLLSTYMMLSHRSPVRSELVLLWRAVTSRLKGRAGR